VTVISKPVVVGGSASGCSSVLQLAKPPSWVEITPEKRRPPSSVASSVEVEWPPITTSLTLYHCSALPLSVSDVFTRCDSSSRIYAMPREKVSPKCTPV